MRTIATIFPVLLIVTFFVAVPNMVSAQTTITREQVGGGDSGDFVVGPGKVELSLNPGEYRVVEMTVTNRLGEPRQFNIGIEDAAGTDDPARPVVLLGADRGPYTLKDYLSVPEMSFVLNPGERARIPVTVSIPENAEPGGRYGSVLVTTNTIPQTGQVVSGDAQPSSALVTRIGTLFFITIPGSTMYEGALEKFSTIPDRWFKQSGPISFSVLYRNSGSVHVNPYGEITITNMLGESVGFIELDPWYALPQSLRFREVRWDREWLFGRYTATLSLNRGYEDIVDTATVHFWVIPWQVLVPGVIGIIIGIFLIRYLFTRFEFRRKST